MQFAIKVNALRVSTPATSACKRCLHACSVLAQGKYPRFLFYNKHKKVTDPARQDPEHFEKLAHQVPIDDRYVDTLTLLWPEKIGSEREVLMKGDDSLIGRKPTSWVPEIDEKSPRVSYADMDWDSIPESVKKIFSIEFGERRDFSDAWKKALIDKVRKHELDRNSIEVKIAWTTAVIRGWSQLVEEINNKPRKPVHITHPLFLMINYRRKLLRQLQEVDSEAFQRVITELKIAYHVPKRPEQLVEKRRKAWIEALLKERIEREQEKQLEELHASFVEKRKKRGPEIKKRLNELVNEERQISDQLKQLAKIEGKIVEEVPKYQPKLIESLSEIVMHAALYHRPEKSY